MPALRPRDEIGRLVAIFIVWRTVLLIIAYTSPGYGYDTSTTLLGGTSSILPTRLVRWDAIYYAKVAQRGYLFEQEWAFGWGYSRVLKLIANCFPLPDQRFPIREAWSGIAVSHASHLISVLALYDTSRSLFKQVPVSQQLPYVASMLHIFSPAGLFLSAPYGESLFSGLSFLAYDLYVRSLFVKNYSIKRDCYQLISALLLGLTATVRSNGLLHGLLFVSEAIYGCSAIVRYGIDLNKIWRLIVVGLCGCIVGLGYIVPQYIAYQEYCSISSPNPRPWCKSTFPSIYNYVQVQYWNTGLFRYWTISNLPLFVIGAPCIFLFIRSSSWSWSRHAISAKDKMSVSVQQQLVKRAIQTLAIPQIALVVLILSSFHVQIITRLSSGYLVWYWWLAQALTRASGNKERRVARTAVAWMVAYAAIQGALFAGFLPPA